MCFESISPQPSAALNSVRENVVQNIFFSGCIKHAFGCKSAGAVQAPEVQLSVNCNSEHDFCAIVSTACISFAIMQIQSFQSWKQCRQCNSMQYLMCSCVYGVDISASLASRCITCISILYVHRAHTCSRSSPGSGGRCHLLLIAGDQCYENPSCYKQFCSNPSCNSC